MIKSRTGPRPCKSIRYVGNGYRLLSQVGADLSRGERLFPLCWRHVVRAVARMRAHRRGTSPINISQLCALIAPPPKKSWQRASTRSVARLLVRIPSGEKRRRSGKFPRSFPFVSFRSFRHFPLVLGGKNNGTTSRPSFAPREESLFSGAKLKIKRILKIFQRSRNGRVSLTTP